VYLCPPRTTPRLRTKIGERVLELEMRPKLKRRDMLCDGPGGSKWDMRGPEHRGSDTQQTSVIYILIISALFNSLGRLLITFFGKHKHAGRDSKEAYGESALLFFLGEIYGMLLCFSLLVF
jgi:hypothetical protein